MIYVYALTDALAGLPPGALGLGDEPLQSVVEEGVGAVFSGCPSSPAPEPHNLWRHEAVAEALMDRAAALPTRFGTTLAGVEPLRAVLARNLPAIRSGLERVRGCVEVGVRVRWEGAGGRPAEERQPAEGPEAEAFPGNAGRAYLRRRLAEERRQRAASQAADNVHAPLARYARDAVRQPARVPGLVLTAAYLVERDHLDGFVAAVRGFDRERDDRQVLCTGPWPPYSFVPTLELEGALRG